jgi:hypothetical protein
MITALVQFAFPTPVDRARAAELFKGSAPRYRDLPGLVRKYYLRSEDGRSGGGVYLWKSREAAEQVYTPEWRALLRERYGAEPVVTYFDTPVVVDNALGQILAED